MLLIHFFFSSNPLRLPSDLLQPIFYLADLQFSHLKTEMIAFFKLNSYYLGGLTWDDRSENVLKTVKYFINILLLSLMPHEHLLALSHTWGTNCTCTWSVINIRLNSFICELFDFSSQSSWRVRAMLHALGKEKEEFERKPYSLYCLVCSIVLCQS